MLGIVTWIWVVSTLAQDPLPASPALRQTGEARGHTEQTSRARLCERAEDAAWRLVWQSCDERHRIENVITGACATVDFRPAGDDGRGPSLTVRVQVEYDCRPPR